MALLLCLVVAGSAYASALKARGLYEKGRRAEVEKNFDAALEFYEQAIVEDTENQRYDLAARRVRFVAGQFHVDRGQSLRDQGQLDEALAEFRRAIEIDPASSVAGQEFNRTKDMIERRAKAGAGYNEPASPLERERQEREEKMDSAKTVPVLKPLSKQPITFNVQNQTVNVIFETIGKLAGVNVLFDPEFQDSKKYSIEIQRSTLYDALDYASMLTKAYWKPITENAIFVTQDNTNKRRDFEEEVVKTFYLTNVATPQEMQEVATAIRGLTDIRRLFVVNSMNALILRGTADKVALAEKVINDVDKARSEVIIDVLVLETSKTRTRTLGITPVSGGGNGISLPVSYTGTAGTTTPGGGDGTGGTGGGTSTPQGAVKLSDLGRVSTRDFVTTLPGGQLNALMNSSDTRLLQSPRVRAADNFKADLRIGDRIPIATGSFQPGIGGVGINPLVNTQFNYTDVGVNVVLTPKIHGDEDISIHVEIEISNVRDFVDIGGISQPVIGQRKVTHDIRIQEGEASVLGGLFQSQTFITKSGVPFLGEIPVIGRLFSSTDTTVSENEILIVLIPHLVRLLDINDVNTKSIASGTDQIFKVRYEMPGNGGPALPETAAEKYVPEKPEPATVAEEKPAAAETPKPSEPAEQQPAQTATAPEPADPEPAEPAAQPAAEQPAAAGAASFRFGPSDPTVGVGSQVSVNVFVDNAQDLMAAPLRIQFDPKILRLADITRGALLEGDGVDLIFSKNIRNEVGQAAVNISRFPGTGGVNGNGVLVTLIFEGVAPSSGRVRVVSTGARTSNSQRVQIPSGDINVTVR